MQRCPACGREVEEGLNFCGWCGASLASSAESPPGPDSGDEEEATAVLEGAPASASREGEPDETAVLPRAPGEPEVDPGAATVVTRPAATLPPAEDGLESVEAGEPLVHEQTPDQDSTTVVSAPRPDSAPAAYVHGVQPLEGTGDSPTIPDRHTNTGTEPALELIEVDEHGSEIPRVPEDGPNASASAARETQEVPNDAAPAPPSSERAVRGPVMLGGAVALAALVATAGWLLLGRHGSGGGAEPVVKVIRMVEQVASQAQEEGPGSTEQEETRPPSTVSGSSSQGTHAGSKNARTQPILPRSGFFHVTADVAGLPAWPPPKVTVFAGKRYKGRFQTFGLGRTPRLAGTVLRDNAASSLKVAGGVRITLYSKPGFSGRSETFSEDRPSLKGTEIRNNAASSLEVSPPRLGPALWHTGQISGLGVDVTIERHADAVVVRSGDDTTYILARLIPPTGGSSQNLIVAQPRLARALGPPHSAAVRVADGTLAVQLFTRGVVVYSPDSQRGWYRIDGR